jgi:hypothetical protein
MIQEEEVLLTAQYRAQYSRGVSLHSAQERGEKRARGDVIE